MWITRARARASGDEGQSSVELIALLPALAVIAALALQAIVAGATWWLAANAAREAARAQALGADPATAARAALPSTLRGHLRVGADTDAGRVRITLPIPSLLAGLRLGSVSVPAHMEAQR